MPTVLSQIVLHHQKGGESLAQAKLADYLLVTFEILSLQVIQQPTTLAYHFEQALSRVVVLGMDFEVVCQVLDPFGENRDLNFR